MNNLISILNLNDKDLAILPPRERVFALENAMKQLTYQVMFEVTHEIANGMYARTMYIPAGGFLTGKIHKTEHLVICNGDITIYDESGLKRYTGYNVFVSKPGVKRAGLAFTDTQVTGIFKMSNPEETDITKLEEEFTCLEYQELDKYLESKTNGTADMTTGGELKQ